MLFAKTLRVRVINQEVSTDDIIPARYKHMYTEPEQLAHHIFEHLIPEFASTVRAGDLIVCNSIFGIGSSREQAVSGLKAAGVDAIIAPSFGRIFYRNCWNLGIPAVQVELPAITDNQQAHLNLEAGVLTTENEGEFKFTPPSDTQIAYVSSGGLLPRLRELTGKKEQ